MTTAQDIISARPETHLQNPLCAVDAPPILLVAAMAALSLILNSRIGLHFAFSLPLLLTGPMICIAAAFYYGVMRGDVVIGRITLYMGLWLTFPIFAVQLSYFAFLAGYPLKGNMLFSWDAALGFHWASWAHFIGHYPRILAIQSFAYDSCFWQPLVCVLILAIWGPAARNAELLTAILLALIVATIVTIFMPAIGPADMLGLKTPSSTVVAALRAGSSGPFIYTGLICCPSFHTVMVVLFTLANRGLKWSFAPFLVLNAVMLSSVLFTGDHYLSDVIAGAILALISFAATRWFYRRFFGAAQTQKRAA